MCVHVSEYIDHDHEPCLNDGVDQHAVWDVDSGELVNHMLDGGARLLPEWPLPGS